MKNRVKEKNCRHLEIMDYQNNKTSIITIISTIMTIISPTRNNYLSMQTNLWTKPFKNNSQIPYGLKSPMLNQTNQTINSSHILYHCLNPNNNNNNISNSNSNSPSNNNLINSYHKRSYKTVLHLDQKWTILRTRKIKI